MSISDRQLVNAATAVRSNAYAPFSHYTVGAAVLDEHGELHVGCNVENSSFPCGSCAEAGAISAMVAAGGTRIVAIAAVGGRDTLEECTPCGNCRQRISEFADTNTRILLLDTDGKIQSSSIEELLPGSFRLSSS
ncbi:MAG: cytidine deaminase [Woeseia sp.]